MSFVCKAGRTPPKNAQLDLTRIDQRTREAKLVRRTRAALLAQIGPHPTPAETLLVEHIVQMRLRLALWDRELAETGKHSDPETYLATSNSLVRALARLGMRGAAPERASVTLTDYLSARHGDGRAA